MLNAVLRLLRARVGASSWAHSLREWHQDGSVKTAIAEVQESVNANQQKNQISFVLDNIDEVKPPDPRL
eukprot:1085734-Rhodomonas_salina.1